MSLRKRMAGIFCCLIGLSIFPAFGDQITSALLFSEAIKQTQEKISQDSYAKSSPYAERTTSDFIAGLIGSAWRLSHYARHLNAPKFSRGDEFIGLPGLFNPDNIYRNALLEESASYRITGTRGSHTQMTFQFIDSFPMIGLSQDLLVIDLGKHGIKSGDNFELFIGGPEREGLWWPMPQGAKAVLTRQTFNDWVNETPTTLDIVRLDAGLEIPNGTDRLSLAARYLDQVTTLWVDHYMTRLRRLPVNFIPPLQASKDQDGGLSGQQTVMARFKLKDDEALIITSRLSDAAYQAIQLGNYWFATQNPVMHQSSLNLSQTYINDDGYIRYVISLKDPGIANWLDPDGSNEGYILMRWQGIQTPLATGDRPVAQHVLLTELQKYLPKDSLGFAPELRKKQIRLRSNYPSLTR